MKYYNFDFKDKLIKGFANINKEKLINFYKDKFINNISARYCIIEKNIHQDNI